MTSASDLISRVDRYVASLLDEADRDKASEEGGSGADAPAFAERVALLRVVSQYLSVRNGLDGAVEEEGPPEIDVLRDELAEHRRNRPHRKIGGRSPGPVQRA